LSVSAVPVSLCPVSCRDYQNAASPHANCRYLSEEHYFLQEVYQIYYWPVIKKNDTNHIILIIIIIVIGLKSTFQAKHGLNGSSQNLGVVMARKIPDENLISNIMH